MNGVHDMGGMHGFGPIEREPNESLFHAEWEARVRAMADLTIERGYYNVDAFRHGIERMAPAEYLRAPYFERWLATVETNMVEAGFVTRAELNARAAWFRDHPDADPPAAAGAPPRPPTDARPATSPSPPQPRFAVGDAVVARNFQPTGHTRLPRYARGKRGVIDRVHEPEILPDLNAHGLGSDPQVLYAVRFDGRELWGESTEPNQTVALDLWECYLESDVS